MDHHITDDKGRPVQRGGVSVTKTVTAQNSFSDGLNIRGDFNVGISGTFVATVWIQRSFDSGSTWLDVDSFTSPIQTTGYEPEAGVQYRAGVKTGGFTSGSIALRISQ